MMKSKKKQYDRLFCRQSFAIAAISRWREACGIYLLLHLLLVATCVFVGLPACEALLETTGWRA